MNNCIGIPRDPRHAPGRAWRAALALALAASMSSAAPASAAPRRQANLPPECATKTVARPLSVPSWIFVLNFEVVQAAGPLGCLLIFRAPRTPTDTVPVPCQTMGAGVGYGGGLATFTGGHVRCPINVTAAFASLTPPIVLTYTYEYPYFTLVGLGRLAATATLTEPFGNPIAYYRPNDPGSPDLGLFVPLSNTPSVAVITSLFNRVVNTGTAPFQLAAGGGVQAWSAKHNGFRDVYTVTHSVGDVVNQVFVPRTPVTFWANGGAFSIGASPYGPSLRGVLDEVVIDPPDGGPPPLRLPLVIRGEL